MFFRWTIPFVVLTLSAAGAPELVFHVDTGKLDVVRDGRVWLRTVTPETPPTEPDERAIVYTHVFRGEDAEPITKGEVGTLCAQRGLFIGWGVTRVTDAETGETEEFNTWAMSDCHQEHERWLVREIRGSEDSDGPGLLRSVQEQRIHWNDPEGRPFIRETRTIRVWRRADGRDVIDFESRLEALRGPVQLRGDSHHGGMQVRLADEIYHSPEHTRFIVPEDAERIPNDEVSGAWWATCSAVIRDKRYWVQHMTATDHPAGEPVYSIRPYARFGAFTEPDIDPDSPVTLRYRIVVSEEELDQEMSAALYQEYLTDLLL